MYILQVKFIEVYNCMVVYINHRGFKYFSVQKTRFQSTCTEVYILQVKHFRFKKHHFSPTVSEANILQLYILWKNNIFKCRKHMILKFINEKIEKHSDSSVYSSCRPPFSSIENTIFVNLPKGINSSMKKLEKHLHRGVYPSGR